MAELKFTVDSAILGELGERLVETVYVALSELVKNAYDADATEVTVKIIPDPDDKEKAPSVEIIDNGNGMTMKEIKDYWMHIATTNKVDKPRSKRFGRVLSGAKGIGRFACRRLGTKLELHTVGKVGNGKYEETQATFDWLSFKRGVKVTDITVDGKRKTLKKAVTGTKLIISGGDQNEWGLRGYQYVQRQLVSLVANQGGRWGRQYKEDPGFEVILDAPGVTEVGKKELKLREKVFEAGWGTVTAEVDTEGTAHYCLEALGAKGKGVHSEKGLFPALAGARLKFAVVVEKKEMFRNSDILTKTVARTFIKDWGGIQVRANGVRIYPYGNDDWLDIDSDRGRRKGASSFSDLMKLSKAEFKRDVPLLNMLSMRSHYGYVELESLKPFQIKLNREGFVKNEAFSQLKEFARFAVDWATIYRDAFVQKIERQEVDSAREELERVSGGKVPHREAVSAAAKVLKAELKKVVTTLPQEERERVEKVAFAAEEAIVKADQEKESEIFQLRLIASTATLLLIFSHEIRMLFGTIEASASSIRSIGKKLGGKDGEKLVEISGDLVKQKKRMMDLAALTALIGRGGRKSNAKMVGLHKKVEEASSCFQLFTEKYHIEIINDIPEGLVAGPMLPEEALAIFINAISNSVKSVIAKGGNSKIKISGEKDGKKSVICVSDNGVGLSEDVFEDVFMPFATDPENKLYQKLGEKLNRDDELLVSTGNGLGLGLIKDIVSDRGGEVCFIKPQKRWSATLQVKI